MNTTTATEMIIMATVYLIHTNGVQHMRTHTSKASAVKVAESMRESAEGMTGRNIITVTTQARGKEVYRWESPSVPPVVEIQGEYVEAEDAHGHIAEQTAWMTQEGVCVGLCAIGTGCEHCDEQYGPVEPQTDAESVSDTQEESTVEKIETVNVVQAYMGSNGMNHYHAPGCRDIEREAKRHSARKDLGVYAFAFPSVASIIEHEYGDCNNDEIDDMIMHANSDFDGLRIMPCLAGIIPLGYMSDGRMVGDNDNGREWSLYGAPTDHVELSPVEFTEEQISTQRAEERYPKGSHVMVKDEKEIRERVGAWSGYVVAHGARPFGKECARPWWIPTVVIERGDGSTRTFLVGDVEPFKSLDEFMSESDPGDAGFMETDSVELADWEKEVLEIAKTSRSTGITKHSITSDGNQWESFQHVLSVGDIVRVTGMQGVYEVHCLVPGLPTVYVLGTTGEPFPVSATATYAI